MDKQIFLAQLNQHTLEIIRETREAFSPLNDKSLNWSEGPGKWSILQCFAHLNLYNAYYIAAIERSIDKLVASKNEEHQFTWIGKKSVAMMHPQNRKKQKTFKKMQPVATHLHPDEIVRFLNDQERILSIHAAVAEKNINQKEIAVEFFRLLKMNIGETLEFIIVHEQRHLIQAREILNTQQLIVA